MSRLVNINRRERTKRTAVGVVGALAATGLGAWLVSTGQPHGYRVLLAVPVFLAMLGFFQAAAGT